MALRVAVTGPTGEIGISTIEALEAHPDVTQILGMARRPFDPAERGWSKTVYRQGDILDRDAVDDLVSEADVVVHLAFIIMGTREESAKINLAGTRNVFEATVSGGPRRLVYTSSVAAYGYHSDNPVPITEDVPTRGTPAHYYSEQKAACEQVLAEVTAGSGLEVFVLRPCIVAGPKAPALAEAMPWNQLPDPVRRLVRAVPVLKPPMPDPGTPVQLVHHDDVASAVALAATTTTAPPGAYNIAGDGLLTFSDVGRALGARPVKVPHVAAVATSEVLARLPFVPSALEWLHAGRASTVMDTSKAKDELGWQPTFTAAETLAALAETVD
ncbi:NAD-dependent epimerase/dehydratase family protein [Mycobacterium yunnanensis]|uniref:NAD-dependent epimerase/dehydratase family protein n=1 Tax=Mycobacterium yunnanensis TaxID=368477 RepID=A0A9X2YZJ6_9MYCO|nr:NAD-dependent epimerase/dehydratase family protein [Mycobacterium yunnanensis]MCV7420294.1 NAD-dependent epimerase/dehydratase family protein [Mycobacterium yunnanensis]